MSALHEPTTLRVAALDGLDELLRHAGVDLASLLRRQGIDPVLMQDPENRYTFRQHVDLLEAAAAAAGDELLGLRLGMHQSLKMAGILGYTAQVSPDVRTQVQNAIRYLGLHQDGASIELIVDAEQALISYSAFDPQVTLYRLDAEQTLAMCVNQWRVLTGLADWSPASVHFEHPAPAIERELRRFFGCPVHFSEPFHGFRFPAAFLDTPVASADPGLHNILARYAEDCLQHVRDRTTVVGRIRRLIASSLSSGTVTIDHIAKRMAMTPRTLQRRLGDEGMQFSDLVDATRRDLAVQYLRDPRISPTDTAFLVGYSDLPAFHRAFRRWFNQTPLDFQRESRTL